MQDIPDGEIDCIICDCPYGQLNRGNPGAAWDVELPLGKLWEQWLRIAKPDAPIILFGSGMFTAKLMMSQPKLWRYNLIWDKVTPTGFLNANRMPLRVHEDICVFYRKLPVYNPQMKHCGPHRRNHGRGKNDKQTNNCYGEFVSLPTTISDEKFPTSILTFPKACPNESSLHPTLKPTELLRWLIRTYTKTGGVVLDCCMGSGSTCVAAVLEHRRYCGIEINDKFFETACKRVADARQQANTIFDNDKQYEKL